MKIYYTIDDDEIDANNFIEVKSSNQTDWFWELKCKEIVENIWGREPASLMNVYLYKNKKSKPFFACEVVVRLEPNFYANRIVWG